MTPASPHAQRLSAKVRSGDTDDRRDAMDAILKAIDDSGGNRDLSAATIGVHRSTLYRWCASLDLVDEIQRRWPGFGFARMDTKRSDVIRANGNIVRSAQCFRRRSWWWFTKR